MATDADQSIVLRIAELEACQYLYVLCEHYRRLGMTAEETACKEFAQSISSKGHLRMIGAGQSGDGAGGGGHDERGSARRD